MAEVNREFMAPMLSSGLVFGQPGVHRHSDLPWRVVMLPEGSYERFPPEGVENILAKIK